MTELTDEDSGIKESELGKYPKIISEIFDECHTTYRCPACDASKRGTLFYDPEWDEAELIVIIECRSCGNEDMRYYGSGTK